MLKKYSSFLGIASLILLVFAGISYLAISHDRFNIVPVHLVLAFICFLGFVSSGGRNIFNKANRKELLKDSSLRRVLSFSLALFSYSGVFIGIVVLLNLVAYKKDIFRFDSTAQKVHSLAPQTVEILSSLKKPVFLKAFYVDGIVTQPEVKNLLERVEKASDKLRLEIIDPEKAPLLAKSYDVTHSETLVFSNQNKPEAKNTKLIKDINEQSIANSLLKLKKGKPKNVYYLAGHGEPSLGDASKQGYLQLKEAIKEENLALSKLILSGASGVPEDTAVLVLVSPEQDYLESERNAIESYLDRGGKALILGEPKLSFQLKNLLKNYGILTGDDILIENSGGADDLGVQPKISNFSEHPATKDFRESTVFDVATSVRIDPTYPKKEYLKEIAYSGKDVWGEKNFNLVYNSNPRALKEDEDHNGPLPVALAYQAETINTVASKTESSSALPSDVSTKMVVFGDSDFVTNENIRKLYNRDLFLNSLNWLVGEQKPVTIRARTLQQSLSPLTELQFSLIFFVTSILLPELLVASGFLFWWSRLK